MRQRCLTWPVCFASWPRFPTTLLYPASEEPPDEGESEAALRLPKAESRRQPEILYTRALAEVNSGLDLLTHSILRIFAPRYRRVKAKVQEVLGLSQPLLLALFDGEFDEWLTVVSLDDFEADTAQVRVDAE